MERVLTTAASTQAHLVAALETEFDVFISYSRRDGEFARLLDRALRRYRPPHRSELRPGYLRVFRDESDMTGVEYGASIRRHLDASFKLVVICSPHARASRRVAEEIEYFAASHGWARVVPVLYSGLTTSEATPDGEALKAFPEALMHSGREPLAVEYRDFVAPGDKITSGRYFASWCGLLSNLYDVSRAVIEQRENRRRIVRLRTIGITGSALVMLLSLALLATLRSRAEAASQRDRAVTTIGRILAERAWQALGTDDRHLAAQYALAGWQVAPSTQADQRVILASIAQEAGESRIIAEDGTTGLGVAINSLGNLIATTGGHGNVRLWEVPSGRLLGTFSGHQLQTTQAIFSADGTTVLSSSEDGTIRVWRASDQQELGPELEPGIPVRQIAMSPNGQYVVAFAEPAATLAYDQSPTLSLWRVSGEGRMWTVAVDAAILAMQFTADGKSIITVDEVGELEMRNADTGARNRVQSLPGIVRWTAAAIDPVHDIVATGASDGTVQMFRLSTAEWLSSKKGHEGPVRVVAIAPSGRSITSTGDDGAARLWSVMGGHGLGRLVGHRRAITSVTYGPGDILLTAGADSSIRSWSIGRVVQLRSRGADTRLAVSPTGSILAISGGDTLFLYGLPMPPDGQPIAVVWPQSVALTVTRVNDTSRVASIDTRGRVISGSVPGSRPAIRRELRGQLLASALSPDGSLAAITTFEQPTAVSLVDIASGAVTILTDTAVSAIHRLHFSRDGSRLVAGSQGGWIAIWNVSDHSVVRTLDEPRARSGQVMINLYGGRLRDVALNRDGSYLAYVAGDGTGYVLDVRADRVSLLGPTAVTPLHVAISDDAQLVALGGPFGWEIWHTLSRRRVARFDKPTGEMVFTPDARHVVAGAAGFVGDSVPSNRENPLLAEFWDVGTLSATILELSDRVCTHFLTSPLHWFSDRAMAADLLIDEALPSRESAERTVCPGNATRLHEGGIK